MNNSVGEFNQNVINKNHVCNSKCVSDLGGEEVTKGNSSLIALGLNIQGLSSSIDNLRQVASDGQPVVIGLCETFLDSGNEILLDIHGYKMEHINRCKMAKGGLAIYIYQVICITACGVPYQGILKVSLSHNL